MLIPPESAAIAQTMVSKGEVQSLARQIGGAPGLVVMRMQREKWLPYTHMNDLKVRYVWHGIEAQRAHAS